MSGILCPQIKTFTLNSLPPRRRIVFRIEKSDLPTLL